MIDPTQDAPSNDKIDYTRAELLEEAIRQAANEYSFTVLRVHVRSGETNAPEITIELRQQPGQVRR